MFVVLACIVKLVDCLLAEPFCGIEIIETLYSYLLLQLYIDSLVRSVLKNRYVEGRDTLDNQKIASCNR